MAKCGTTSFKHSSSHSLVLDLISVLGFLLVLIHMTLCNQPGGTVRPQYNANKYLHLRYLSFFVLHLVPHERPTNISLYLPLFLTIQIPSSTRPVFNDNHNIEGVL